MSGLSRTPGKRVWVNSPPRVRIPLPPPERPLTEGFFSSFSSEMGHAEGSSGTIGYHQSSSFLMG